LGGTAFLEFGMAKTSKIWRYLGKRSTLSANIFRMDKYIDEL